MSVHFEKERYTPYTTISGVYILKEQLPFISKIKAVINSRVIHYGPVDKFECYTQNGINYISFSSRGFSMGLSQNLPEPGIHFNVNLDKLIENSITVPKVSIESGTAEIGYIYIKEGTSLWDAIVALGQKATGSYPYIHGDNQVRFTPYTDGDYNIGNVSVLRSGKGTNLTSMISHIHMKDTEDKYGFNYENPDAAAYGIVRHKYISLDRQWIEEGNEGLAHKVNFSKKGLRYRYLQVCGYVSADLRTNIVYSGKVCGEDFGKRELSRIAYDCSKNGFTTTLWFYEDGYTV